MSSAPAFILNTAAANGCAQSNSIAKGVYMHGKQLKGRLVLTLCASLLVVVANGCSITKNADANDRPFAVPVIATASLTLSGDQEVPAVTTAALGTGSFEIPTDQSITGEVATTGIIATAAHVHEGAAGKNGPVVVPLTRTGDNTWSVPANTKLTDTQYRSYLASELYVNVHSANHPDGEIRAQLKPK